MWRDDGWSSQRVGHVFDSRLARRPLVEKQLGAVDRGQWRVEHADLTVGVPNGDFPNGEGLPNADAGLVGLAEDPNAEVAPKTGLEDPLGGVAGVAASAGGVPPNALTAGALGGLKNGEEEAGEEAPNAP